LTGIAIGVVGIGVVGVVGVHGVWVIHCLITLGVRI
jgi:hypothetical protein